MLDALVDHEMTVVEVTICRNCCTLKKQSCVLFGKFGFALGNNEYSQREFDEDWHAKSAGTSLSVYYLGQVKYDRKYYDIRSVRYRKPKTCVRLGIRT